MVKVHFFQADISKQKAALQKYAVVVKPQQKEVQTATLELGLLHLPAWQLSILNRRRSEQLEKDIDAAKETLEEAKNGAAKLKKELSKLADELKISEVSV